MFDGTHHADEHMGVEMTLHIFHWLVDGYGVIPRITNIVDSREVYIVFLVNPDGAEYDIWGGKYHFWRKNRQPIPGSTAIGTDLNRNYGYKWGLGGRTSANPRAITYHGPRAFSAPETRAIRDFLASRVVDGRQQIRAAISFHELGRLVMWPYGYTKRRAWRHDRPGSGGAVPDRPAHGRDQRLQARAGERPVHHQGHDQGLHVRRCTGSSPTPSSCPFATTRRPSMIASETGRNKEAVLYLMEQAGCPYAVLGAAIWDRSVRRVRRRSRGRHAAGS